MFVGARQKRITFLYSLPLPSAPPPGCVVDCLPSPPSRPHKIHFKRSFNKFEIFYNKRETNCDVAAAVAVRERERESCVNYE